MSNGSEKMSQRACGARPPERNRTGSGDYNLGDGPFPIPPGRRADFVANRGAPGVIDWAGVEGRAGTRIKTRAAMKCPYCAEEIQPEAIKCKHCGSWIGPEGDPSAGPPASFGAPGGLSRPTQGRMIAGVCAGLARSIGLDPTIIRILFALGTFFTAVAPGVIVYIILAFIMPSDDAPPA